MKKNPHRHGCSSLRRSKIVKNATKFWVCEIVKDWIMEDEEAAWPPPGRLSGWSTDWLISFGRIKIIQCDF